jgi:hypothetical protein
MKMATSQFSLRAGHLPRPSLAKRIAPADVDAGRAAHAQAFVLEQLEDDRHRLPDIQKRPGASHCALCPAPHMNSYGQAVACP